jgi:hypothetical protein
VLKVLCTVSYADTGECRKRVINWDDLDARVEFAQRADWAFRNGGKVMIEKTDLPIEI